MIKMRQAGTFLGLLLAFPCCAMAKSSSAQQPPAASSGQGMACTLAPPTFVSGAPNIFTDEQEQYLGEAMAEMVEADLRLAPPSDDDQLTRIGERLLATLPPTKLHYRFRIYESGELNAFSLGGGRVYISRKMVAAAKNEDELAGVIAHEIGHIATHQFATEFTRTFRIRLGVTQVTDRADVFARVHQMFSTPAKKAEGESNEEKDQLLADHTALYAMVRAGYAPESFATFLDKTTVNKGKTGNALTDFFGMTSESNQRYRSGLKLIAELPGACKGKPASAGTTFLAWQKAIVDERVKSVAQGTDGDQTLKLESPLRPELWRIRFSNDGRYVLAQDEGGISVVDRNATKVLFRIDAPDVKAAQFTPDSQSIVFDDANLRVERWSVATGKRISVKEMVIFDGCDQAELMADGTALLCAKVTFHGDDPHLGLRLFDVDSGTAFYDKANFYNPPTNYAAIRLIWNLETKDSTGLSLVNIDASPDGRYVVASIGDKALAYDLANRKPVELGGKLHGLGQSLMAFMGSDQLYLVGDLKQNRMREARVLSFPDGRVLKETEIGNQQVGSLTKAPLITVSPLKDFTVGILDPAATKVVTATKTSTIDMWEKAVAVEGPAGGLQLGNLGDKDVTIVPLPLGNLPAPRAAAFSADGNYLAVSLKDRGELWNLSTGKKIALLRPFRSAWMDNSNKLFGQFPKYQDKDPLAFKVTLAPPAMTELGKYETGDWQYHDLQLTLKPNGKDKSQWKNATLEVRKMGEQATVWTKNYPHETPALWGAEDDRIVLAWDLSNESASNEIKNSPALQKEMQAIKQKKKGLFLQTVAPGTGAILEQVVIPEADLTKGWNDVRRAFVSGEYVLVRGEHDNSVIYRLDSGEKVGEFFGRPLASDSGSGIVAAINREDEVLLVDEYTGKEIRRFSLGSPVRTARIVIDKEKRLLVLTADQVVHRLPLPDRQATGITASK